MALATGHIRRPAAMHQAQTTESAPQGPVRPAPEPASLLEQALIPPDMDLRTVILHLDTNDPKIGLVVDDRRVLLGTVTDGDIRRAILRGLPLEAPVTELMNPKPRVLPFGQDRSEVLAYLQCEKLKHLPIVDFANRAVDLITLDELLKPRSRDNWVVIMAGGKGMRLRPLTENTPKPMLDVGGRPILETIVRRCAAAGFDKFFLSVNYQADVIKDHFGDGKALGTTIEYIEETEPLGTAGPLRLLPDTGTSAPLVVMNGDILTKVDPAQIVAYHQENAAAATMAVREYELQVPYGVIDLDNNQISAIREKPLERYFINAGIYTLDANAIRHLPSTAFDMPDLFQRLHEAGHKTLAYPIREYWVDIGQMDDYQRANLEFAQVF